MDYYIYRAKQYIGDVPNYIFLRPYVFLFFGPEGIILFIVTGQGLILDGKQKIHILDLWRTQFRTLLLLDGSLEYVAHVWSKIWRKKISLDDSCRFKYMP